MSSTYAPGASLTAAEFGVSETVSLLGVSLFCLGLALGPTIGAPLSETFGRLIVFRLGMPIAVLFSIGAAVSNSIGAVLVCRFFAGVFGSPPLSIGGGTIADIWPPATRGPATTLFVMAPFLGPCIGRSHLLRHFWNETDCLQHLSLEVSSLSRKVGAGSNGSESFSALQLASLLWGCERRIKRQFCSATSTKRSSLARRYPGDLFSAQHGHGQVEVWCGRFRCCLPNPSSCFWACM